MDNFLIPNSQKDILVSSFEEIEFAQKITSLHNTLGGQLIIGVNGKGKVLGIYPQEELDNIPIVLSNYCSQPIEYSHQIIELKNKLILVLTILQKKTKIAAISIEKKMEFYYRINQHICVANKIIEKVWSFERENVHLSPCLEKDLTDVYNNLEKHTLSQIYNHSQLAKSIVDQAISWLVYTNKIHMNLVSQPLKTTLFNKSKI